MDVSLASHAHHVPQVGCPHKEPVAIAKQVKSNPMGAKLLLTKKEFLILNKKFNIDSSAIKVKHDRPIHAEGT